MMMYNLMRKWNLLLLNSPSWQSDMLVSLRSYDCIYIFGLPVSAQPEILGLSQVTPQNAFFASNIALSGLLGTAYI